MPWDYSIYPKITQDQKKAFTTMGETLYMIQLAEHAIKICIKFVFNNKKSLSLESIYANKKNARKTLGRLLNELRAKTHIHLEFDSILKSFVDKRNFFVHSIFDDLNYSLSSYESCEKLEQFPSDLQDDAWNVQNVFWGCLIHWAKANGVFENFPEEMKNNKHIAQIE